MAKKSKIVSSIISSLVPEVIISSKHKSGSRNAGNVESIVSYPRLKDIYNTNSSTLSVDISDLKSQSKVSKLLKALKKSVSVPTGVEAALLTKGYYKKFRGKNFPRLKSLNKAINRLIFKHKLETLAPVLFYGLLSGLAISQKDKIKDLLD